MGYPMMAMSACFGGPMLSNFLFSRGLICRHPPWCRSFRVVHELNHRTRIPDLDITDSSRLDDILIHHLDQHVNHRTLDEMAHDSTFWNLPRCLLYNKYNSKRSSRNNLLITQIYPEPGSRRSSGRGHQSMYNVNRKGV